MNRINQYKKQIFTFITIILLLQFGVYPCLTMANTIANMVGALGLVGILLWVIVQIMDIIEEPSNIETGIKEDLKTIKKPKRKPTKTK